MRKARDWAALTFSTGPEARDVIVDMMMASREAVVNYMTPLGLTHLMGTGHHYGPAPWVDDLGRADLGFRNNGTTHTPTLNKMQTTTSTDV